MSTTRTVRADSDLFSVHGGKLANAGAPVRVPAAISIAERWTGTLRRELSV